MEKTKVIQGLKDGDKIISDCDLNMQDNYKILEALAEGNTIILSMIKEANEIYCSGHPNQAKRKHFEIIERINTSG